MTDTVEAAEPRKIESKPKEQLTQLARDILANLVFTDRHCQSPSDISMVFLPIGLGGLQGLSPECVGMLYEYFNQAGPTSVNGMPCFFSVQILNQTDATFVCDEYRRMELALKGTE